MSKHQIYTTSSVTLHVSVWVEIDSRRNSLVFHERHAPRERVSWNSVKCKIQCNYKVTLHVSVWVEINPWLIPILMRVGHAPRERVSWNTDRDYVITVTGSHAPRERVSWNRLELLTGIELSKSRSTWACELKSYGFAPDNVPSDVTLHVSVWVEMPLRR